MIKQSKLRKQVIQDEIDAATREGERLAQERAANIQPPPVKESFWTKLKRAIGAVP